MALILASQSPRRKALLELLNIPFSVQVTDTDEAMDPGLPPEAEVARVSRLKAQAIPRQEADTVIAADTVVVLDGKVLGKPADEAEAKAMLKALSGRTHQVMTGLTVLSKQGAVTCTEITQVRFRPLSSGEISRYVASGDPMDKAGAYGIQSGGALFVESICGDYYNVMGLPVCRLWQILTPILEDTL